MTEDNNNTHANTAEPQFTVQRVYLKDLSFESPLGAKAFLTQIQPNVDQELGTETQKVDDKLYEMVLKLTMTAKHEDEVVFLIEVQQAGLFFIDGIDGQSLTRVLNTTCPQILFPYAREVIDSALTKGSFPPLMLPPINFEALFEQAMADQQGQQAH